MLCSNETLQCWQNPYWCISQLKSWPPPIVCTNVKKKKISAIWTGFIIRMKKYHHIIKRFYFNEVQKYYMMCITKWCNLVDNVNAFNPLFYLVLLVLLCLFYCDNRFLIWKEWLKNNQGQSVLNTACKSFEGEKNVERCKEKYFHILYFCF